MDEKKPLTKPQARMLRYLSSGKPIWTQRQLAIDAGFDHPQKATAAVMGLLVKGYLVVEKANMKGG